MHIAKQCITIDITQDQPNKIVNIQNALKQVNIYIHVITEQLSTKRHGLPHKTYGLKCW